ncbi:MAG: hypothetical protein ACI8PQ_001586, partial [Planctomycetota bacterium]
RTGWCLAVLGNLTGTDLLGSRRESWGPWALSELVLEAHGFEVGTTGPKTPVGPPLGGPPPVGERHVARQVGESLLRQVELLKANPRGRGYEVALLLASCLHETILQRHPLRPSTPSLPSLPSLPKDPLVLSTSDDGLHILLTRTVSTPELLGRLAPLAQSLIPGAALSPVDSPLELRLPKGWVGQIGGSA